MDNAVRISIAPIVLSADDSSSGDEKIALGIKRGKIRRAARAPNAELSDPPEYCYLLRGPGNSAGFQHRWAFSDHILSS